LSYGRKEMNENLRNSESLLQVTTLEMTGREKFTVHEQFGAK